MNANTRIVLTTPRSTMSAEPAAMWRVLMDIEHGHKFWVEEWWDINKMTPAEAAQYVEDTAEGARMEAAMIASGWKDDGEPPTYWPTVELALEWARFIDVEESIDEDLAAFGAPSECSADAHRGSEARREALLAQAL